MVVDSHGVCAWLPSFTTKHDSGEHALAGIHHRPMPLDAKLGLGAAVWQLF